MAAEAEKAGHKFYAITNGSYDEVEDYRHTHQAAYPFYNMDQIELKIVIRSNPGLVLIKNGVVINKWAWRDFPAWADVAPSLK